MNELVAAAQASGSHWGEDYFDRHEDAEFLLKFVLGRIDKKEKSGEPRSYVLNIDGDWGTGKSFFLKGFASYLRSEDYLVATVNAWRDDFVSDPLIPIMSAIEDAIEELKQPTAVETSVNTFREKGAQALAVVGKGVLKTLARKAIGDSVDELLTVVAGDDAGDSAREASGAAFDGVQKLLADQAAAEVEQFRKSRSAIEDFGTALAQLVKLAAKQDKNAPLFILVDELDRCRPNYAVALLERVKHLFDVNDVVFVFATNASQLSHAVRAIYGSSFGGEMYLHRFFEQTYRLPTPTTEKFVLARYSIDTNSRKISLMPGLHPVPYLTYIFDVYGLDLRSIGQCIDILEAIVDNWDRDRPIYLQLMMPMIIGYQLRQSPEFSETFFDLMASKERPGITNVMQYRLPRTGFESITATEASTKEIFQHFDGAASRAKAGSEYNHVNQLYDWTRDCAYEEGLQGGRKFSAESYPKVIATAGRLQE